MSKRTDPPFVVIEETTASAPATSKSPITTLALHGRIFEVNRRRRSRTSTTYPCFEKATATSLPIPFAPPARDINLLLQRHVYVTGEYHTPVRTTTFPLARSAYVNNSLSEMIVVMAIVEGEERNRGVPPAQRYRNAGKRSFPCSHTVVA